VNGAQVNWPDFAVAPAAAAKLPVWPATSIVVLLVLAILAPAGLMSIMAVCLLILAAIVWLTSYVPLPGALYHIILPFVAIALVGMLAGMGAEPYLYFKDAWYALNPALILVVGFVLYRAKPDLARGLRAFVVGGVLVGAIYIAPFVADPSLLLLQATLSRDRVGAGYFAPALALLILLGFHKDSRASLGLPTWIVWGCALFCGIAVALAFSRTLLLTLTLGLLAVSGFVARRAWLKAALIAVALVASLAVLKATVDVDSAGARHTFVGKLARSLDEMSMHEYPDRKHINENYRGYESARALHSFEAGEPWRWVVGQGFGASVDLKLWIPAVGRYLPVLHNGYFYLLFKTGLLGTALLVWSIYRIYTLGRDAAGADDMSRRRAGRLMQGIALGFVSTTWVISGVFNKEELYPFLLCAGFLCGYLTDTARRPVSC
jgi:hypothetical protein